MREQPNPSTDPAEVAWAAGLFEGEGSFHAHQSRQYVYGKASLQMTDEDVVRRFHRVVGCGKVYFAASRRPPRKPLWVWASTSRPAYAQVVELLWPWLGARRKAQLEAVAGKLTPVLYDGTLRSHCLVGHALTPENVYVYQGERSCRLCARRRKRESRARLRLAAG